tara:strand:+ start:5800 stop:6738 length:939 start_codon:yes stop_codon:yes gene_type:complete
MDNSAFAIFKKLLDDKKKEEYIGDTPVDTSPMFNDNGVMTRIQRGGKEKWKGYVVSLKKLTENKKPSTRKIYKKVKNKIKEIKKKGTRKQNKELEAWKLQEKGLSKRIGIMEKNTKTSKKINTAFSGKKTMVKGVQKTLLLRELKKAAPKYSNSILKYDYYKDKLIEHNSNVLSTVDSPKKSAFNMLQKPKKYKVPDFLWDIWATHHFVTIMEGDPIKYNPAELFDTIKKIPFDTLDGFRTRTKTHKKYPNAIDYDKLKKSVGKALIWLRGKTNKTWTYKQRERIWVQKGGRRRTRKRKKNKKRRCTKKKRR